LAVPPAVAVIVTFVEEPTVKVVTANATVEAPARTVALAGTVAAAVFELVRVTIVPPAGAAPFRATVAVEVELPKAVEGERVTESAIGPADVVSVAV
jgi:hypothetical protein